MVLSLSSGIALRRLAPANDDRPRATTVGNVALALRVIFPNASPAQAEVAARELMACVRPAGGGRFPARRIAH